MAHCAQACQELRVRAPAHRPLDEQPLAEPGLHRGSRASAPEVCYHRRYSVLAEGLWGRKCLSLCAHPPASAPCKLWPLQPPTGSTPTPSHHLFLSFLELGAGFLPNPSMVPPGLPISSSHGTGLGSRCRRGQRSLQGRTLNPNFLLHG